MSGRTADADNTDEGVWYWYFLRCGWLVITEVGSKRDALLGGKKSVLLHLIFLQSSLDILADLDRAAVYLSHMDTLTSPSMPLSH